LLNRDDSGLAKRLSFGGLSRTRISSQCLKRHWRKAQDTDDSGRRIKDDPHALQNVDGFVDSVRSREIVTTKVIAPLRVDFPAAIVDAIEPEFQKLVYGDKADKGKKSRQTLLLGEPEIVWLAAEARRIAKGAKDAKAASTAAVELCKSRNANALAAATAMPGGIVAALFGRMVTSDFAANIDSAVHVSHAFTVHGEEADGDYFTAVDDLKADDENGADTIQETELTSGIFYGYVVVDVPGLIANCGGDAGLAARIVHHLVYLIAEVSPGAKLGSTAPYGRADFMLLEAGDRQPRSLAEAYRKPALPDTADAVEKLASRLHRVDLGYGTNEERAFLNISEGAFVGNPSSLNELAAWAESRVKDATNAR
jgi:CRISPR system Cascade subunit CasC